MRTILMAAVAGILAFGTAAAADTAKPAAKPLTAEELSKYLEQKDKVVFLDVREPAEIAQLGSVKGYVNIPLSQLEQRLNEIPKDKLIVTL